MKLKTLQPPLGSAAASLFQFGLQDTSHPIFSGETKTWEGLENLSEKCQQGRDTLHACVVPQS